MEIGIIIAVVVVALVFDYTNGFHDAANAIATSVSTRAHDEVLGLFGEQVVERGVDRTEAEGHRELLARRCWTVRQPRGTDR